MNHLNIYQDNYVDSTIISNHFIDEYMKDANDAQIKIYLYLMRMMRAHLSTNISEMADKFNYTEKDVVRALKYWEKKHLLSLDYDDAKSLTGIHFNSLDKPGTPAFIPAEIVPLAPPAVASADETAKKIQKPSYSLDEVKAFRAKEDTEQLLFIIEQYIGRPLSANDIRTILFICDELGFSADLIDYLIQYCVSMEKKDFRYIEKVALNWAEDSITTPKQAAVLLKKYNKNVYTVMNALGKSGTPVEKEMEYIERWYKEYHFSLDVIKEACNRTVLATDKNRIKYADSILKSWFESGVSLMEDIKSADENYIRSKKAKTTPKTNYQNSFNQFEQRSYDFTELEKELLSN